MIRRIIFFVVSLLLFSACGGGDTQEGTPYVQSDSMGERTTVSISSGIRFLFNKEIDEKGITDENFFLYDSNGTRVDTIVTVDKKYLIVAFDSVLDYDSNYTFALQDAKDLTGTKMKSAYSGRFTTRSFVMGVTPENGESAVSVFADIVLEFGEEIDPATLSVTVDGLAFPFPASLDNKTFTISPSSGTGYSGTGYDSFYSGLAFSTDFNITISAASDIYGNALQAPVTSSFATVPPDTTPPVLVSSLPSDVATGVAADSNITLLFDENIIAPVAADFSLIDDTLASKGFSVIVDLQNNSVVIDPSSVLDYAREYTLSINNISDVFGNIMTSSSISFTTSSILKSFYPVQNSFNAPEDSIVTAVFKGAIDYSLAQFTLEDSIGTPVDGNSSFGSTYASFTPTSDLKFSSYYTARISGVKDIYGNSLAEKSWSFTTKADDRSPRLILATPANLQTGVAVTTTVSAVFDEDITGEIECVLYDSQGGSVDGDLSLSGTTVTFTPLQNLESLESYTAIFSGVSDQSSNMAPPQRWEFTTE